MNKTQNADVSSDSPDSIEDILTLFTNSTDTESPPSLLSSLKPYLNPKRQKKLEQCERILSLSDTLNLLSELHLFDNNDETTEDKNT